ncbi:UNVERIFIED_ORG: hypothetical protein E4P37_17495 [Bacillus sp. AZ43]
MSAPQQPPAPYVPQGYELKKKKPIYTRVWFWILVVVIVAIAATAANGGGSDSGGGDGSDGGNASGTVEVTYTLESDAPQVSATYMTLDGGNIGQAQDNNVAPPWSKTLQVEDSFIQSFTLTGQMSPVFDGSSPDGTTITCRITVDGEVVAEQTSTGQYAIVSCNAN